MRFRLLICFLLQILISSASAQISVGARGGFGFSATSLELNKGMERNSGVSPMLGVILHYNIDLKLSAGLEVNYYRLSESVEFDEKLNPVPGPNITMGTSLSYIQVPVTARASIGDKKYRGFISLGPYIGFAFDGKWTNAPKVRYFKDLNGQPVPNYPTLDTNYTLNQGLLRKFDIGGLVSGGFEYLISPTDLAFAEARVQLGFLDNYILGSDARRAYSNSNYVFPSASWRAVNFSLGYIRKFKLPKFSSNADNKRAGKQKRGG